MVMVPVTARRTRVAKKARKIKMKEVVRVVVVSSQDDMSFCWCCHVVVLVVT